MESAGPTPHGALLPADHTDLQAWFRLPGPVASVQLDVAAEVGAVPERRATQWRNAAAELRQRGAPADLVDRLGRAVQDAPIRPGGAVVGLAAADRDPLVAAVALDVPRDLATWSPLPRVGLLLEARQRQVPHVVVLTDRLGADIYAVAAGDGAPAAHREVQGEASPVERNAPGRWSQPRYQRRVHTSWEENAADVAAVVQEVADDIDAELVALAGDVRAVELVQASLPGRHAGKVQVVTGSRHPDGSEHARAEEVQRLVDTVGAATTAGLLQKLREELGQRDRAVSGPGPVLEALARGQVQVLLVHDDPDDVRGAWFGPDPLQVGELGDEVRAMGVEEPSCDRLVDVAIRAAFGSGAGVRVVPHGAGLDDVAALLRWTA